MARISTEEKKKIEELSNKGLSARKIADELGLKPSTVAYQIKKMNESSEDLQEEDEEAALETDGDSTEDDGEDKQYWKDMSDYWKDKYLTLHADHVVLVDAQ